MRQNGLSARPGAFPGRSGARAWVQPAQGKTLSAAALQESSDPLITAVPPDTSGLYEKAKKVLRHGAHTGAVQRISRAQGTGNFLAQKKYTQEAGLIVVCPCGALGSGCSV